ncbi:glycosyltransferase family 2 protein [Rhizophagus clarus]|uniref:Glycosyltransferase family 2 protein n=1 Tax=Rhizophagus clarus TaxID=94130 RepID=A0A8H3R2I8_9GLOM|nr:glycosyltransferase family 2 protein [Rhizophagus clarus]
MKYAQWGTRSIFFLTFLIYFLTISNGYKTHPLITSISTYPPFDSLIPLKATKINITYSEPIIIFSRNITIFQYFAATGFRLLRQTYPASAGFTKLSSDNKTLTINIFDSTFNKPNSIYHIIVESDAVRRKDTSSEPVLGIQDNVWNVTTGYRTVDSNEIIREPVIAFIRLSSEGTEKFNSLDESGKSNFINNLGKELAFIVPVEENHIISLNRYQKDQRTKKKRILIAYKIGSINNNADANTKDIMNDLQALIIHGESTLVSNLEYTKNLDITYGIVKKRNIFRDNKIQLILLIAAYIICLFLLTLMVYHLNRKADIGVILKFIIALVAFVFYTVYTCENAQNVEKLALASGLLLVLPFVIKLSLGLLIIIYDSRKDNSFYGWVNKNKTITFFFIFLSGVDLNAIVVLGKLFHSPLSVRAIKWSIAIECVGLFLRDLPILAVLLLQFYGYSFYYDHSNRYDETLPLLDA